MQNFIVLGYIPGTQIQLSFTTWLLVFMLFIIITAYILKRRNLRYRVAAMRIAHLIRKEILVEA